MFIINMLQKFTAAKSRFENADEGLSQESAQRNTKRRQKQSSKCCCESWISHDSAFTCSIA